MAQSKHIYETTRDVEVSIGFETFDGRPHHSTSITHRAAKYVFRGGKRAFAAHLASLNAEHGEGYAVAVG